MSESLKIAVQAAVLRLLEPLVKWLLEAGLGVGDLQTLIKIAYVRAAREQGMSSGAEPTRPNASRIAVVTGLTRGEVAVLLKSGAADQRRDHGRQRTERVLSGWWNDPAFQDSSGAPAVLPLRGGKRSFAALVERYSGERWLVATILDELLRVRAVRRLADGRIEALSRTYATVRWDPDGVAAFGEQLQEHCATLLYNLKYPTRPRYVRRVLNARLDPKYVPMLTRDLEQQAEALADSMDDALNDPRQTVPAKRDDGAAGSLGITFYVFEAPPDEVGNADAARALPRSDASRPARARRAPHKGR
jgi:hypothetical protein